jgi:site-specific recombinase XerD
MAHASDPPSPALAELMIATGGRIAFAGDDERVFCNPFTGRPLDPKRYAETLRAALTRAKVTDYVRPFHDGRHTSLTNAAAAGIEPTKLKALAGHSDFATTQGYIDLAGEVFREEAGRLEERLFGTATREAKAS